VKIILLGLIFAFLCSCSHFNSQRYPASAEQVNSDKEYAEISEKVSGLFKKGTCKFVGKKNNELNLGYNGSDTTSFQYKYLIGAVVEKNRLSRDVVLSASLSDDKLKLDVWIGKLPVIYLRPVFLMNSSLPMENAETIASAQVPIDELEKELAIDIGNSNIKVVCVGNN
jgi:hypothetical protein